MTKIRDPFAGRRSGAKHEQDLTRCDMQAGFAQYARDRARLFGDHGNFHLHRLDHKQGVTRRDTLAGLDQHLPHAAVHVGAGAAFAISQG